MHERIKALKVYARQLVRVEEGFSPSEDVPEEWVDEKFAELIVRMCADAADMAYDARCKYPGDYVGEQMGYGAEEGISTWRSK